MEGGQGARGGREKVAEERGDKDVYYLFYQINEIPHVLNPFSKFSM